MFKKNVNYFIGDSYSFNKAATNIYNLQRLSIIDNITPVEIKNQLVKYAVLTTENSIYVGFPRIFNFKCFITGDFKNFLDEVDKLKSKNKFVDSIYNLHNDYVIELHNYCQVFYKLKKHYKFKVVDEWKVFDHDVKIFKNNEFHYNYVKNHFQKLLQTEFDLFE